MDLTTETHKVKGLAESRAVGCCECLTDRERNRAGWSHLFRKDGAEKGQEI